MGEGFRVNLPVVAKGNEGKERNTDTTSTSKSTTTATTSSRASQIRSPEERPILHYTKMGLSLNAPPYCTFITTL